MKTLKIHLSLGLLFLLINTDIVAQCTSGGVQGVQPTYFVNQTYQFNYTSGTGPNFFWSSTLSGIISGPNTAQGVYVFSSTTGAGEVCVTRYGDNTRPSTECIPVNFQPCPVLSTPGIISGNSVISACGSYDYSISAVANATRYIWTGFRNGAITTNTPIVTITPSNLITGSNTVSVQAVNDCGNSSSLSPDFIITMTLASQENPNTIIGPGSVTYCQNLTYTYYTPAINGAVEYHWGGSFVGFGAIITTVPQIDITDSQTSFIVGGFPIQTTLTLKTKDICGVFSSEISYQVTMNPASPNFINWPRNLCRSSSRTYNFNIHPIPNAYQYIWTGTFGTRTSSWPFLTLSGSQFSTGSQTVSVYALLTCPNSRSSIQTWPIQVSNPNFLGICPSGTSLTSFTVSPNPSSQNFRVTLDRESSDLETEINIYNQQSSAPVHSLKTRENEIDFLSLGLKRGIYLIEVKSAGYREVKRLAIEE